MYLTERFVYDARNHQPSPNILFLARLVHFRSAPTSCIIFARTARQNRQNLSKSSIIRWILREHTCRCKNTQYTEEPIAAWHWWSGQLHHITLAPYTISITSNPTQISVQNKWQKTVWTLLANVGTEHATRGRTSIRLTSLPSPLVTYHSDWFMPNFL